MNFPFGTNGKFIILGVPILKHIRVFIFYIHFLCTIESGNTARPLTLRIKNVNGRSKIISNLMSRLAKTL